MQEFNTILDYIIEQVNRYDSANLQFERDILFNISRYRSLLENRILGASSSFTNLIQMQQMLNAIENYCSIFYNQCVNEIKYAFKRYYDTSYKQMDDLLQLGEELESKFSKPVTELRRHDMYSDESIKFLRDHAFDLMKGHSKDIVDKARNNLGDMMLRGQTHKSQVRAMLEKTLGVNRSKAEEIAQTELSRAYNYGTMARLYEYRDMNPDRIVKKYWHGFKYSKVTCTYCRPRIGHSYDLDDDTESLPAHVRCRCIWIPMLDGWDSPISSEITRRANMLNAVYTSEQIYDRINSRLGIDYGSYIDKTVALDYLSGDRTPATMTQIGVARENVIDDTKQSFDIAIDNAKSNIAHKFNTQISFWKNIVAEAIVDKDTELLNRINIGIKGVMALPWDAVQLDKWNRLLGIVNNHM